MRTDQLTFTRFIAATSIVIMHYGMGAAPFCFNHLTFIFDQAAVGVSYFFILSGYVMVLAYGRKSINAIDYYKNRFARIYPMYILALVLAGINWRYFSHKFVSIHDFAISALLLQTWYPNNTPPLNPPGWSLSVELVFYVLFPILIKRFYNRYPLKIVMVSITVIWGLSQAVFHILYYSPLNKGMGSASYNFITSWPIMHLNEFLIGNAFGYLVLSMKKNYQRNYDAHLIFITILMLLFFKFNTVLLTHNGLLAIFFCPFIGLLTLNTGNISKLFRIPFLKILGEASYSIYILQYPAFLFMGYFFYKINPDFNAEKLFYAELSLLILMSIAFYFILEVPLRRFIKGLNIG